MPTSERLVNLIQNITTTYIYSLSCPLTKSIRYIGKTYLPIKQRLYLHISKRNSTNSKKNLWIRELAIVGLLPIIEVLETVPTEQASFKEKEWISKLGISNLLNGNLGGGGNNYYRVKKNSIYIAKFRFCLEKSSYSKNSKRNFISYIKRFISEFEGKKKSPKEINQNEIRHYIGLIKNKNTRNAHIVALKCFYKEVMNQPKKLKFINYEYM